MQIALAILLAIVAVVLFLSKRVITNDSLERAANVGGVVATIGALLVLALYTAPIKTDETQQVPTLILSEPVFGEYPPIIPTETLMTEQTNTPTSTETLTPLPIPSDTLTITPTATHIATATLLVPEDYGGLVFDCIPDRYWDVMPNANVQLANGCFLLGNWGLHADYRQLNIILPSQDVRDNLVKDLFLPITGNVDVSFTVTVKQFGGSGETHAAPLFSVGICNEQYPEKRNNFILYSYRDDGSILWGIVSDGFDKFEKNYSYKLGTPQDFVIQIRSFDLTIRQKQGSSINTIWNKTVVPEDLSAFCIRYTLPTLGELTATVDNLLVKKK